MTLLVDNQLPLALARYLATNAWECIHVQDVALETATDRTIWQYAPARAGYLVDQVRGALGHAPRPHAGQNPRRLHENATIRGGRCVPQGNPPLRHRESGLPCGKA